MPQQRELVKNRHHQLNWCTGNRMQFPLLKQCAWLEIEIVVADYWFFYVNDKLKCPSMSWMYFKPTRSWLFLLTFITTFHKTFSDEAHSQHYFASKRFLTQIFVRHFSCRKFSRPPAYCCPSFSCLAFSCDSYYCRRKNAQGFLKVQSRFCEMRSPAKAYNYRGTCV